MRADLLQDQRGDAVALGLYAARYAYLVTWPAAELLEELAGGPVDLAELRAGFQEAAKRIAPDRVTKPEQRSGTARRRRGGRVARPAE